MGIIATAKVVTQTRQKGSRVKKGRPTVTQPGNRAFVIVIEGINASGWALPPTVIFEGKVHQSTWYRTEIPDDWVIGVSENGWMSDQLGYKWLTEIFDKHTWNHTVGKYHLLFLDGHGSHFTPQFNDFCEKNSIIWLCCPPHSTHLLQPLDVGCFSPLKNAYGRLVQERAQLGIHHIDKPDFLVLYQQARMAALSEKISKVHFERLGLFRTIQKRCFHGFKFAHQVPYFNHKFHSSKANCRFKHLTTLWN
jgi:DDE superfamily endonuclease